MKQILRTSRIAAMCFASLASASATEQSATTPCAELAELALPQATVTRAQLVPAGRFAGNREGILAPGAQAFRPYSLLPSFCRIAATLTPSSDSEITFEVWMPTTGWTGRFEGLGNGGWGGAVMIQPLARALLRGSVAATTDTGHTTTGGSFAFNHPEKLIDFAYRAVHDMTIQAKALTAAFYGKTPDHSYWIGCSTGGRQGLKEAQAYPDDYDGILAGDPTNDMTHMFVQQIWVAQATLIDPARYIPQAKYGVIHRAVLDACDVLDGVKDGVLEHPPDCVFDPVVLQCPAEDRPTCLTSGQVEAARRIYGPVTNPRTGAVIFPGLVPGSEIGWASLAGGPGPLAIPNDYFKFVVFKDPDWDYRTLNFDADVARTDAVDDGALNATEPNLAPFFDRGGKLLMYHGWNDQLVAPANTVNYFNDVIKTVGAARSRDSLRLFMVPGMTHCAGGDGTDGFDGLGTLQEWVEHGIAPNRIVASRIQRGQVQRTRPLCPYPAVATYRGTGDTDEAASFVCQVR